MRDNKKSQFFRVENEIFGDNLKENNLCLLASDSNYSEEKDLAQVATDIISTHTGKRFESFIISEGVNCRNSNSFKPNMRMLDLPLNYRNVPYLMHSIAHTLSQYTHMDQPTHGPLFVTIYMMLLNRYLEFDMQELKSFFDHYNIPYAPEYKIHQFLKFDKGFKVLNKPHKQSKEKLLKLYHGVSV